MIGQDIAHFRVTEKLDAGGMGELSRAIPSFLSQQPLRSTGQGQGEWKPCHSKFVLLGLIL